MDENIVRPVLLSVKPLKSEYHHLQQIAITSENFSLGRGLKNSVIIPFIAISRNHCAFIKSDNNEWLIDDYSSFGIKINNEKMEKGKSRNVSHNDIISLEPSDEFVYKFSCPNSDVFEIPRKRIKLEKTNDENNFLDNVKIKFEESQSCEINHIKDKIQSTKKLQSTSIILKQQLQLDMDRKMQQLEADFAQKIESLEGEKIEVEKQKASLIKEKEEQLAQVKNIMERQIAELMAQIQKHNETESELFKENNLLKEKLHKEREEFLAELSRESSSKQDMLHELEAKIREQEEVRLKEKQELQEMLRKETELLVLAKEKELKELEEQKKQRELELKQELENIKKNLQEQMQQTENQRLKTEEHLNMQMEHMKKLSDEEKIKLKVLLSERETMKNELAQALKKGEKKFADLRKRVSERETELAALAAERIQKQADQSSVVITTLQEQLESVKNRLESVETEKKDLLINICNGEEASTSKQAALMEVGELMENELQCSICAELFIEASTLNCSHTFCKYCITKWKKKKKDCPICRSSITAENRSLVLDTFIDKMVQNLTEEMKAKRQEILKFRAEEVLAWRAPRSARTSATSTTSTSSTTSTASRRRRRTHSRGGGMNTSTTIRAITRRSQIPTVDLTMLPIPNSPLERPPVMEGPMSVLFPQHMGGTFGEMDIEDEDLMALQNFLEPTTAGTGTAPPAVPEGTVLPHALSDNIHSRLNNLFNFPNFRQ